ncbi:Glycosyl transferase family 2 [Roseovarius aestuarii]|uniref:Glycosyl transferase family 2 n=2 Tax=Roseovarius aestuarii TaxID=475083 RepID=A0A1X7BWL6_9RHOB|nr:Glycosyl transferase family 2 [Roseovarius aestuarii]
MVLTETSNDRIKKATEDRNMKLIVQILALNEEETLGTAIAAIPRDISGITTVEVLVTDDGSTDRTVEVAHKGGADHILQMPCNVLGAGSCDRRAARPFQTRHQVSVSTPAKQQPDFA